MGLITGLANAEVTKILASDGADSDRFGNSIGISGTIAIVGAEHDDDNGSNSGSAYLYDSVTGQQLFKLLPTDGISGAAFGHSVAISGSTAIVGVSRDDDNGVFAGAAYVFNTTTGQQQFKLLPTDGTTEDVFGRSVAISGTTAIVGAHAFFNKTGSAYLFNATNGQQILKITPSDGAVNDRFGRSVAISGTTAIIGAPRHDQSGSDSGAAYLFDTTTGSPLFKLLAIDGMASDKFGISVAINGTTAVVGSLGNDNPGAAYIFDTATGNQLFKLMPSDVVAGEEFGFSVGISGTIAIVGASRDTRDPTVGSFDGSAYFYDTTTGQLLFKLRSCDSTPAEEFGVSVGISGDTAIIGAWHDRDNGFNAGAAYITDTFYCPSDLNNDGVIDTADLGILIGAFGSNGPQGDINCDVSVDTADLGILIGEFGSACP